MILSSCASLTKEECLDSEWGGVGKRDGSSGFEPRRQFNRHVKACKRVGVIPDQSLWYQGYQSGLANYCTPTSGLRVGQSGRTYYDVCPATSEPGFMRGYVLGDQEHKASLSVNSLETNIASLQNELDTLLDQLGSASSDDARSLRQKINHKRNEIADLRQEKEHEVYNLQTIKRTVIRFQRSL